MSILSKCLVFAVCLCTVLPASDQDEKPARTDVYGDPLPAGAVARLGTVRFRSGGTVLSLAFSPKGTWLASLSRDWTVRLWDRTTGKEVRRFPSKDSTDTVTGPNVVHCIAFSPDGKTLCTGHDEGTLRFWDVATGKEQHQLRFAQLSQVSCLAFSPTGEFLAMASGSDTVLLWDLRKNQFGREIRFYRGGVCCLAFAPDGKSLAMASCSNALIAIYPIGSEKQFRAFFWEGARHIVDLAYSPDGKILVSKALNRPARLWDAATGKPIRDCEFPDKLDGHIALAPDGKTLASAGNPGRLDGPIVPDGKALVRVGGPLRLWDVATGKIVQMYRQANDVSAASVAFSPDGAVLASGDDDGAIHLWDLAARKELCPWGTATDTGAVTIFSPDGRMLVSRNKVGRISTWDAANGMLLRQFEPPPRPDPGHSIPRLAFLEDQVLIEPDGEGGVRYWNVSSGKLLRHAPSQLSKVLGDRHPDIISYASTWKTLACSVRWEGFYVCDITGRDLPRTLPLPREEMIWTMAAFAPDGRTLALGLFKESRSILLWDVVTGQKLHQFPGPQGWVEHVSFSPDGRALASTALHEQWISLWRASTGRLIRRLEWKPTQPSPEEEDTRYGGVSSPFSFSPDGRLLAVACSDRMVRIWELASGQERCPIRGHQGLVSSLSWSSDSRRLVTTDCTSSLVWDLPTLHGMAGSGISPSAAECQGLWSDLASSDARRAARAVWLFALGSPQTVSFLKTKLQPVVLPPEDQVSELIRDLDNSQFRTRESATAELKNLAELAAPNLRRTLAGRPSAEMRQRIESLLALDDPLLPPPRQLQSMRAIEALEKSGTAEARAILQSVAEGAPEARLTQHAKAALARLSNSGSGKEK